MMKAKEIRQMSIDNLKEEIYQTGKEQFNLKIQHSTRQLTATHQIKVARRKLARLLTVLNEKVGHKA